MAKFTFFWKDGKATVLEGATRLDAFNSSYSAGALAAIDFFADGDVTANWEWDKTKRDWMRVQKYPVGYTFLDEDGDIGKVLSFQNGYYQVDWNNGERQSSMVSEIVGSPIE